MSFKDAWREYAIKRAPKQVDLVDQVTEEAPFFAAMPVQEASHELQNTYEEVLDITEADTVDFDAALPSIDANTELKQKDLTKIGGIIRVGEDKADLMGGASSYFAGKLPLILRKTGNAIESSLIYNSFRAFAFAQSKLTSLGGSYSATPKAGLYSILCIKWTPGEMYGLVGKGAFNTGKVFDMQSVNGGNRYEFTAAQGGNIGFGMTAKTILGTQLANARYISGLVNCKVVASDAALPTEAEMSNLVLDARARPGNSVLVMHPRMKTALGVTYKLDKLQLMNADNQVNSIVDGWDGIPILETYNMLDGTEAAVTL
jgi:hypothetical protein